MKTSLFLPFLLIFVSFLAAPNHLSAQWGKWGNKEIKGNGQIEKESRKLGTFEGVQTCCSMEVFIHKGSDHQVQIETDENILEYVSTEVRQGQFVVRTKDGASLQPSQRIKVYLSMPDLVSLEASSSSHIRVEDTFPSGSLHMEVSSSATVELSFEGDDLRIEGSSSGKIKLRGKAQQTRIEVSSSCRVDADGFVTRQLRMEGSSSGRVAIGVAEELRAELSSSARLSYTGQPTKVITDTNSGAKVIKLE